MAKASQMAKQAGKAKATDSTIASLESRTSTQAATAPRAPGLKYGANFTGQYLYDRFINDKAEQKADVTKMDIVRQMVNALDAQQFGKVISDFVGVAKGYADNAIKVAKDALGKEWNEKNPPFTVRDAKAKYKTAQNHQTVMRTAFGTMKFCAEELAKATGDAEVGYRMIREIGAGILATKGINWDGTKAEDKKDRAARVEQREETEAMLEVQAKMPRGDGESRAAYMARIDAEVDQRLAERAAERHIKTVETLAEKVRKMAGDQGTLAEVLDLLLSEGIVEPKNEPAAPNKDLH